MGEEPVGWVVVSDESETCDVEEGIPENGTL